MGSTSEPEGIDRLPRLGPVARLGLMACLALGWTAGCRNPAATLEPPAELDAAQPDAPIPAYRPSPSVFEGSAFEGVKLDGSGHAGHAGHAGHGGHAGHAGQAPQEHEGTEGSGHAGHGDPAGAEPRPEGAPEEEP